MFDRRCMQASRWSAGEQSAALIPLAPPPAYFPHSRSRRGASSGGVRQGGAGVRRLQEGSQPECGGPSRDGPGPPRSAGHRPHRRRSPCVGRSVYGIVRALQRWIARYPESTGGLAEQAEARRARDAGSSGRLSVNAACVLLKHTHTGPRALRRSGIPRAPRRGGFLMPRARKRRGCFGARYARAASSCARPLAPTRRHPARRRRIQSFPGTEENHA